MKQDIEISTKKNKNYKEKGLLQIEVREDGSDKRVYVSANIKLRPDQFSDKMGFTCKNDDNAKSITGKARDRYNAVYAFVDSDKCIRQWAIPNRHKPEP